MAARDATQTRRLRSDIFFRTGTHSMPTVLHLENDHLQVAIHDDGSGVMRDKKTAADWTFNAIALQDWGKIMDETVWTRGERNYSDYYGGRFQATAQGDRLFVRLFGLLNEEMGRFTCRVELDGPWVVFHIEDIDERLPSLVFPPHVHCDSLIIPSGLGSWKRQDDQTCRFMTQAQLTMRWFGGLKADHDTGYMAVYEDGAPDAGLYAKGLRVAPAWLKSMGRWSKTRSIRYRGVSGGYVGMAKVFRQYAQDHGFFRTLKEKIEACPAVGALQGGRIVSFMQSYTDFDFDVLEMLRPFPHMARRAKGTNQLHVELSHADVATIIREAKELGMKRGIFNLRGTFHGGYDYAHPEVWPPEPALGSLDELKAIMAEDGDFVALLHDNYQDSYPRTPSFPKGVIRTSNGRLMHGGFWHGGRCYVLNPWGALAFGKKNWEQMQVLKPRGIFADTLACIQPYEDYNPEARMDRAGSYEGKLATMRFFKEQGVVLGSENAGDFGMYYMDFLENRHTRQPLETPPIWPLVFHDAAFCARYPGGNTTTVGDAGQAEDILWGYAVMWAAGNMDMWRKNRDAFRRSLFVDQWHARIALDEMTHHRYVTEDGLVEQTEFSSGVSVVANFSNETREVEGEAIAPGDYVILE